jgi:hypothetical protein
MFEHSPFDHPKHGVHPSAVWIAWIRSAFFILPGVIPSCFALLFISGIPIRLSATFVAAILCLLFNLLISTLTFVALSPTLPFKFLLALPNYYLIYVEHLRFKRGEKVQKNRTFLPVFTKFLSVFALF